MEENAEELKQGIATAYGVSADDITLEAGRRRLEAVGTGRRHLQVAVTYTVSVDVSDDPPPDIPTRDALAQALSDSVGVAIEVEDPAEATVTTQVEYKIIVNVDDASTVTAALDDKSALAAHLGVDEAEIAQEKEDPEPVAITTLPTSPSPVSTSGARIGHGGVSWASGVLATLGYIMLQTGGIMQN